MLEFFTEGEKGFVGCKQRAKFAIFFFVFGHLIMQGCLPCETFRCWSFVVVPPRWELLQTYLDCAALFATGRTGSSTAPPNGEQAFSRLQERRRVTNSCFLNCVVEQRHHAAAPPARSTGPRELDHLWDQNKVNEPEHRLSTRGCRAVTCQQRRS